MLCLLISLLLILHSVGLAHSQCTPDISVEPCSCIADRSAGMTTAVPVSPHSIVCDQIALTAVQLRSIFRRLSATGQCLHYGDFLLSNTSIDHLPSNVFGNITFSTITLHNNPLLTSIDIDAFDNTRHRIAAFKTFNTGLADSVAVFTMIRQLPNLRFLSMENDRLDSIPADAFNHTKLQYIHLGMPCAQTSQPIRSIGKNAFFHLPNLYSLRIFAPPLATIGKHSLSLRQLSTAHDNETESWLHVYIGGINLTGDSFEPTALTRFGHRPVLLRLYHTSIDYLDEEIFQPFLAIHPSSLLTVENAGISRACDERSAWVREQFCIGENCGGNRVYGTACFR